MTATRQPTAPFTFLARGSRRGHRPLRGAPRAGLTLIELMIASGIISVLLLASAGAMGESIEATSMAKDLTRSAVFLETVEEDLAAMPPNDLLSMNGQRVFSSDDPQTAAFAVDISVFMVAPTLLQLQLTLVDPRTNRPIATLHGMRARA